MPKTINVTATLTFSVDVPTLWVKQETYFENVTGAIDIVVNTDNKKIDLGDVDIEFELEVEEEG